MPRPLLAVMALAFVLAACTAGSGSTSTIVSQSTSTTDVPVSTTTSSPSTTFSAGEAFDLDGQIEWVVAVLNGASTDEGEIAERFTEVLQQYVPAPAFVEVVTELRSGVSDSWEVAGRDDVTGGAEVALDTAVGPWVMSIAVDGSGRIDALLLQPAPAEVADPPESLSELAERLAEFGRLSLSVSEVTTGTCDPVFAVDGDALRPIGSTFKLYVLGAVVDGVARGDLAWNDEIAIRDERKSLPSGTFQTRPVGSTATLLEFAEAMISISDNTATDHLIDLVGRDAVEDALVDYGNANADANRPLLTTRELFALKLVAPDDVVGAWVEGSEPDRRTLLDDPIADLEATIEDAITWITPVTIDEIEWFATTDDQCRALTGLVTRANVPDVAEVRDILSGNPGIPVDSATWSYVGYKGGSEPGVLNLAWYLESVDGRAYTYIVNVTDPEAPLPESDILALATIGIDLIAP